MMKDSYLIKEADQSVFDRYLRIQEQKARKRDETGETFNISRESPLNKTISDKSRKNPTKI